MSKIKADAIVYSNSLLHKALLAKATFKQPKYVIGIDTYDKNALAYCLSRKIDGILEILLCKTMRDEKAFKKEVKNLAKYFNALVISE